ncbi:MAG: EAL domain-containing protein [Candidatus Sumerlaeaceae bacterium]|nr:EAL domain-containing protein [Candidatus Sumerlaeaceae bacterium]
MSLKLRAGDPAYSGEPTSQMLELLYELMTDGVVAFDMRGRIVFCNPAMGILVGKSCQSLIGKTAWEGWNGEVKGSISDQTASMGEQTIKRADGTLRHVTIKSINLSSQPPCQVFIYRDVTRSKIVEQTLRSLAEGTAAVTGEEFFRTLVRRIAEAFEAKYVFIGVLQSEKRDKIQTMAFWKNGRPGENFSYELSGSPCEQVVGQEVCYFPEGVSRLFPSDPMLSEMHIDTYLGVPLYASGGRPLGLVVIMHDSPLKTIKNNVSVVEIFASRISAELERQQVIHDLETSEERYRALIENLKDGIYLRYVDSGVPIYMNSTFVEMFGYTMSELEAIPLASLWAPEERSIALEKQKRITKGEIVAPYIITAVRKDGSRFVAEISPLLVNYKGSKCVQGVVRDITDRQRVENERRTLARLSTRLTAADSVADIVEGVREEGEQLLNWDAHYFAVQEPDSDQYLILSFVDTEDGRRTIYPGTEHPIERVRSNLRAVMEGEPVLINRTMAEMGTADLGQFGTKRVSASLMFVPVRSVHGVIGVLSAQSYTPNLYDEEDLRLFLRVADIVSPALERVRAEEAVRQSDQKLSILFQQTPLGVIRWDMKFCVVEWNPAAEKIFGFTKEEAMGRHAAEFLIPDDSRPQVDKTWRDLLNNRGGFRSRNENLSKSGRRIHCEWYNTPLIDNRGKVIGVASMVQDVTEATVTEHALRESEERYSLAVQGANDGIWDWNLKTDETYFSPRWKSMLGYHPDDIQPLLSEWFSRIHPDDVARVEAEMSHHLDGQTPHFENEHRVRHKDGSYRWMLCRGIAVPDSDGKPLRMAGSQTDITERMRAEEQLLHDAFHDGLTGLPNRALFMEHLERSISQLRRRDGSLVAVLFIDLDRFKLINDGMGHTIGDRLLVAFSNRIQRCLRPGDIFARLGGDEFTILLDDIRDAAIASQAAERVLREQATPFNVGDHEMFVTASVGIAFGTSSEDRPDDIIRNADTAMYRAKAKGKARYEVFDMEMRTEVQNLLQIETDLRRGISRKEFEIHYQPVVELRTGEIAGFEAVVRWHHPRRGLVAPPEFLSVAEETGLIMPLGEWVFRHACMQGKEWQAKYPARPGQFISINLSGKQFAQLNLIQLIDVILEETGLAPENIAVEITESVLMGDFDQTISVLQKLKERRLQICIDDFGTGYSSLSYLHQFPINKLKIDRSFVMSLGSENESPEIVKTIMTLAHDLEMEVIAEGVETRQQLEFLRELGCEYAQGFYFSRPVAEWEAAQMLESGIRW